MRSVLMQVLMLCVLLGSAGCVFTVKHEVPPIYATVNVNLRIQRELEDVFDYENSRAVDNTVTNAPEGGK